MNILLVHGIFDSGQIFQPMIKVLEAAGHQCVAPSLKPADARYGIDDLAIKLKKIISEALGENAQLVIVGFSMGAIIARYYLQELGGHQRTQAFFALAAPHAGSRWARFYPGKGTVDLRPNSRLLKQLKDTEHKLADIALFSYWTPYDVVVSARSSQWQPAKNQQVPVLLHDSIPKAKAVIQLINDNILALEVSAHDSA